VKLGSDALDRLVGVVEQDDDDVWASTFDRGLALGALVGAAIAGSTIWQRRRQLAASDANEAQAAPPSDAEPASAGEDDDR
jgi:hypothetical protein